MKIPKSFQILGQTYTVIYNDTLENDTNCIGRVHYLNNEVKLQTAGEACQLHPQTVEQVFIHEVLHAILQELHYTELCNDETFVHQVASAFHQAIGSMVFPKCKGGCKKK